MRCSLNLNNPRGKSSLLCLGIDPGLGTLGYGFAKQEKDRYWAVDYGTIRTAPSDPLPNRLLSLFLCLEEKAHTRFPDCIAVERLFFGRNTTTAEMVWQARGVILLWAARLRVPLFEPKPAEIKMAVCGNGAAEKGQVQRMVKQVFGLQTIPSPDDAADALAIAFTGLAMAQFDSHVEGGLRF